ncbi:MAG: branched-chain amino acid ABC transporter permease [Solirubrobacterales bacterium]|nr:branched-chain amino acid ABC transporter permease [Solirubrobacterales bacterium]
MEPATLLPLGVSFDAFASLGFWLGVGVIAGTFTIFALGLQLNVGFTGIFNFGQAGFMAIGAYSMAILVTEEGVNFWLSLPIAIAITMVFGLIVGLPSLRLRTDYLAIATLAASEAIRLTTLNARELTNGSQGIFGFDTEFDDLSESIESLLISVGWSDPETLFPLFMIVWIVALLLTFGLWRLQKTPWGRVLRALREDEDAARALGKNAFAYKLQSLVMASALGAIAGFFLALNLKFVVPDEFLPNFTFIGFAILILGGLANYWGVAVGAIIFQTIFEGLRFLELPITEVQVSALRYILLGLVLIGLMAFRPQGLFGKREEMVLGE